MLKKGLKKSRNTFFRIFWFLYHCIDQTIVHAVTFPFRLRLLALISSKMHSLVMHVSGSVAFLLLGSLTLEGPKALTIKSPCELIFFILLCQRTSADWSLKNSFSWLYNPFSCNLFSLGCCHIIFQLHGATYTLWQSLFFVQGKVTLNFHAQIFSLHLHRYVNFSA